METSHRVVVGDARELTGVDDDAVELVVTSPPYPMIEMWDGVFTEQDPAVGAALEAGDGEEAYERMHAVLDGVWDELARVVVDGGIVCVNVGDATRTVDGSFRVYHNHARIARALADRGFEPLPEILWRKPANSAAKFMGSGMLPPNAYVTLEHEFILVFRRGSESRSFEPGASRRYEAAFFWEERNRWFSDVWTDVNGTLQSLAECEEARERSGAFPLAIPYRLVCMYSVYGDTVLDPFWGTGTTSLAAMCGARHSIGCERDASIASVFHDRVADLPRRSRRLAEERLARHETFADGRGGDGALEYRADHHDTPVMTGMETDIRLYAVDGLTRTDAGYALEHVPVGAAAD